MAPPRRDVTGRGPRPGDPWGGRAGTQLRRQRLPVKQGNTGLLELRSVKYRNVERALRPVLQDWKWNPDLATFELRTLANNALGKLAFQVCQVMRKNEVTPLTAHFNFALNACRQDVWPLSLEILSDMAQDQVSPDELTVKEAMQNCCQRWRNTLFLFTYFRQMPGLELASFRNVLGTLLEKPMRWKEALTLWEEMTESDVTPDATCWAQIIKWHGISGTWEESLRLLKLAEQANLDRPELPFNGALFAMGRARQWQASLHIHARMKSQELEIAQHGYRDVVMTCATGDRWQLAIRFLSEMVEEDLDPDRSFSSLVREIARVLEPVAGRAEAPQEPDSETKKSAEQRGVQSWVHRRLSAFTVK
ncbi:MRL1 [Symbiodinium natans]|uniref:MRL1 protein n=1 Tax=Symbiodinium natans TaxID=878477 RepID=A0A812KEC9_9DINO|nr:MRL1 [Symbiodinium natans]